MKSSPFVPETVGSLIVISLPPKWRSLTFPQGPGRREGAEHDR